MSDPVRRLNQLQRRATLADDPLQLPLWSEEKRGVPNEVVRSALFNVRNRCVARKEFKDEVIAVLSGDICITYSGTELRQDDMDVWMQLLHEARRQPLGQCVEIKPYEFLKDLRWSPTGYYYKKLREHLKRMKFTMLVVNSTRLGREIGVSMIRKYECEGRDGEKLERWRIWIEPEVKALFGDVYYTRIDWQQRVKIKGNLAKHLHGVYSSHAQPYPYKVETILEGCGSDMRDLRNFRVSLREALEELQRVGFLEQFMIDGNDLVHVRRALPPALVADAPVIELPGDAVAMVRPRRGRKQTGSEPR